VLYKEYTDTGYPRSQQASAKSITAMHAKKANSLP
jgi:hypothetical protein